MLHQNLGRRPWFLTFSTTRPVNLTKKTSELSENDNNPIKKIQKIRKNYVNNTNKRKKKEKNKKKVWSRRVLLHPALPPTGSQGPPYRVPCWVLPYWVPRVLPGPQDREAKRNPRILKTKCQFFNYVLRNFKFGCYWIFLDLIVISITILAVNYYRYYLAGTFFCSLLFS